MAALEQALKKKDLIEISKSASAKNVLDYLEKVLEQISSRFTKKYGEIKEIIEDKINYFLIPVEFFERRNKLPVPEYKMLLTFKIEKTLQQENEKYYLRKDTISFQIENEAVFYPLFESINLNSFETLLDRIARDKYQSNKALNLHTNFEHTRIVTLNGEKKKLFTIEEEEDIFHNNNSEYYKYEGLDFNFKKLIVDDMDKLIKDIWKTLVANKSQNEDHSKDEMTFDNFKLLFEYGKLDMNEENMKKLWKYSNKNKTENITYAEFANFATHLILCINSFSKAKYMHENNNCFQKKIKENVEIMRVHFKKNDKEKNEEISYDDLKSCLSLGKVIFTKKEIEIILNQINPDKNFQYWKFDKILEILYTKYFDYNKLYEEDKIYKYLIQIFSKQDEFHTGKLHYKKMKKAFLTENKIGLNKMEILLILNQFGINENPEIDYYKASLILRNIVLDLHSDEVKGIKIDLTAPNCLTFNQFEDEYDKYLKDFKNIFLIYDEDYDHLLKREEFDKFVTKIIPYSIKKKDYDEIFLFMDFDKDGVINYKDFKQGFPELMEKIRIKNVVEKIHTIV